MNSWRRSNHRKCGWREFAVGDQSVAMRNLGRGFRDRDRVGTNLGKTPNAGGDAIAKVCEEILFRIDFASFTRAAD